MRITIHPIIEFERGRRVKFIFEGQEMSGYENEPIAAALHDNGITTLRYSLRHGRHMGFFCAIGRCSSCLMQVNGIPNVRTCITPLKEGMIVERQMGKGRLRI